MNALTKWVAGLAALGLWAGTAMGQSSAPQNEQAGANNKLEAQARQTIETVKQKYPSMDAYFQKSAGYAVFPTVTQGAAVVGGTHGNGIVYQNGKPVGESTVSKVSVGAQLGGQTYSELVFFQTPQTLERFKSGNYQFSAGTSAVAGTAGAGAAVNYEQGVAVFTLSREGLMVQASVGGQKFAYQPLPAGAAGSEGAVGGGSSPGGSENSQGANGTTLPK